jgi:hypothetical protein
LLTHCRKYAPYGKKLTLHNGALTKNEDPAAERRPKYRARDKKSLFVQNQAGKRVEELMLANELEEIMDETGSPRKKVCWPILGHIGPI